MCSDLRSPVKITAGPAMCGEQTIIASAEKLEILREHIPAAHEAQN